jgi:hypothetical protein
MAIEHAEVFVMPAMEVHPAKDTRARSNDAPLDGRNAGTPSFLEYLGQGTAVVLVSIEASELHAVDWSAGDEPGSLVKRVNRRVHRISSASLTLERARAG